MPLRCEPRRLVEAPVNGRAEFVIIGAVALIIQGSPRTTFDLDFWAKSRVWAATTPLSLTRTRWRSTVGRVLVMSLESLERAKHAAGRLKDLVDLEETLALKRLR